MTLTADQLRGRVRIQVDGEEMVLRFDQNAILNILERLGLDGLAMLPATLQSFDADILRVLVWAGRLHESPDLKVEDLSEWFYPFIPTYQKAIEGINLAIWGHPEGDPDVPEEADDDADPPLSEPTGTSLPQDGSQLAGSESASTTSGS